MRAVWVVDGENGAWRFRTRKLVRATWLCFDLMHVRTEMWQKCCWYVFRSLQNRLQSTGTAVCLLRLARSHVTFIGFYVAWLTLGGFEHIVQHAKTVRVLDSE